MQLNINAVHKTSEDEQAHKLFCPSQSYRFLSEWVFNSEVNTKGPTYLLCLVLFLYEKIPERKKKKSVNFLSNVMPH